MTLRTIALGLLVSVLLGETAIIGAQEATAWTELQASTAKVKVLSLQNLNLQIEACNPQLTAAFKQAQKEWADWLKANVPDGYDLKPDLSGIAKATK